jgi:hypothetical protein
MDIYVEWDIGINKSEYLAEIQIMPKQVKGSFTYKHNLVDYKVAHKVTFDATTDKWQIQCTIPKTENKLVEDRRSGGFIKFKDIIFQPETVHIDFDNLNINITF